MIRYKKYNINGAEFAHMSRNQQHNNKLVAKGIENKFGIPSIRTMSLLDAITDYIIDTILEGDSVTLKGLGHFHSSISLNDKGEPYLKKIVLIPDKECKQKLAQAKFEEE